MKRVFGIAVMAMAAAGLGSGAWAASPSDGVYTGTSLVTVGAASGLCGKDNHRFSATVVDGAFGYTWDRQANLVIPIHIAADGTVGGEAFRDKSHGASASGTLAGKALEIDLKGKECGRHLSLKKKG